MRRFFFSSRRRHTRSLRDWSSDVCSSDLIHAGPDTLPGQPGVGLALLPPLQAEQLAQVELRSEERRVGKECRAGVAPYQQKIMTNKYVEIRSIPNRRLLQAPTIHAEAFVT